DRPLPAPSRLLALSDCVPRLLGGAPLDCHRRDAPPGHVLLPPQGRLAVASPTSALGCRLETLRTDPSIRSRPEEPARFPARLGLATPAICGRLGPGGISMATMNISLPDSMKAFIEEQAARKGFGPVSEYVRSVIREVQERQAERERI